MLVGAALFLAAIGALVALLAYAVSTGTPDLQLSVHFDRSSPNNPAFAADIKDNGLLKAKAFEADIQDNGLLKAKAFEADIQDNRVPQAEIVFWNFGKVFLRNGSGYSAKNPAVIVRLHAMAFSAYDTTSFEREWASMDIADTFQFTMLHGGLTVVQWDGGPTYSIHGHSTRRLPDLQFSQLWHIPEWGTPALTFEILADGYRKEITLPVDFIIDGKSKFPREDGKINPEWM